MTDNRRRTTFDTPINPDMGEGRFQDALRRHRARIASGEALDLDDCNATGSKHTNATWGLCSDDAKGYPDINDHTFPQRIADDLKAEYRPLLGAREPPKGATCPMDRGPKPGKAPEWGEASTGCFYRCRLFRPVKGTLPPGERVARPPTKEEALKLYDDVIAARELKFGRKTTTDDGEDLWEPKGHIEDKVYGD